MIVYFGREPDGRHYVDDDTGTRQYLTEELWLAVMKAASVSASEPGEPPKPIRIRKEHVSIEKFNCEAHEIGPDTVPAEVVHL